MYRWIAAAAVTALIATASPAHAQTPTFVDVEPGRYYSDAVAWMVAEGITTGTTATTFEPDREISFAEVVTLLWRRAGSPAPTSTPYPELDPGAYYYEAAQWVADINVRGGIDATVIVGTPFPAHSPISREEMAIVLAYTSGSAGTSIGNPFVDLGNTIFVRSIDWLYHQGITTGTSASTFSPLDPLTRAQMATFIWRSEGRPGA